MRVDVHENESDAEPRLEGCNGVDEKKGETQWRRVPFHFTQKYVKGCCHSTCHQKKTMYENEKERVL